MHELIKEFPDPQVLLALEPEELGAKLLFIIKRRVAVETNSVNPYNLTIEAGSLDQVQNRSPNYTLDLRKDIQQAVAEALSWLCAQGLLVPEPGSNGGWMVLSRRARQINGEEEFFRIALTHILPKSILHPLLASTVWMSFIRREFDTAVFQAMKQVEIAVRQASGFAETEHGVPMVRKAFNKDSGPLTDSHQNDAEKEALSNLFAGAIGSYKNPHSHRNVPLSDSTETVEIILLANHLLRIVDYRYKSLSVALNGS